MQTTHLARNIIRAALGAAAILLIPLLGRWPWTLGDFVIMGALLFGTGLAYALIAWKVGNKNHRIAIGIALLAALVLAWAELAVGIFGTPFAGS